MSLIIIVPITLESDTALTRHDCPHDAGWRGGLSGEDSRLMRDAIEEIDRALAGLPLRVKRSFLLNRLEGLTQQAIADQLGVSLSTVERELRRAFAQCVSMGKARLDTTTQDAIDWLLRLESGHACPSQRQVFKAWLVENPERLAAWQRVAGVLKAPVATLHAVALHRSGQLEAAQQVLLGSPCTFHKKMLQGGLFLLLLGL